MSGGVRKTLARIIALAAILGAGSALYSTLSYVDRRPRTDAAEIDAPRVHIAPTVPGRVVAVAIAEDEDVRAGQVLFEVDPEPYRLRLEQAQAEAEAAHSELAQGGRNLESERANAATAEEQIRRARENLALAQATLDRLSPLLEPGYVSAQQVDQARTARNDAEVSLRQAEAQSKGASGVVGTTETRAAQARAAEAAVALAARDLANTKVHAPFDGRATGFKLAVGEYVATGQALGTLIDTHRWLAVGNFRETELGAIEPGQTAQVYVMSDRSRALVGVVEGVGSGVRSSEAAELLGLPYVSNSLTWVRVAKRYPVTVRLVDPPQRLMRIGASAVIILGTEKAHEPDVPAR